METARNTESPDSPCTDSAQLLSVDQVLEKFDLCRDTLCRLMYRPEDPLPVAGRLGTRWRFSERAIRLWMAREARRRLDEVAAPSRRRRRSANA